MNDDRWGVWATLAWSAAILLLFAAAQAVFIGIYVFGTHPPSDAAAFREALAPLRDNGDIISVATLLGAAIGVPAVLVVMKLKRGSNLAEYFPLHLPTRRTTLLWLAATAVWIAAGDLTAFAVGEPVVPDFMREAYGTATSKPLLWIAIVLAAPLFEEALFRGLLLPGLALSRIGIAGGVVVSSLIWAMIHGQYDLFGRIAILVFGVLLGLARLQTGTMLVPLLLHAVANTIATLEVVFLPNGI